MQKQINELLSREMTRQEFLATVGLGIASVLGLSGLLRLLINNKSSGTQQHHGYGYGNGTYGGGVKH